MVLQCWSRKVNVDYCLRMWSNSSDIESRQNHKSKQRNLLQKRTGEVRIYQLSTERETASRPTNSCTCIIDKILKHFAESLQFDIPIRGTVRVRIDFNWRSRVRQLPDRRLLTHQFEHGKVASNNLAQRRHRDEVGRNLTGHAIVNQCGTLWSPRYKSPTYPKCPRQRTYDRCPCGPAYID